MRGGLHDKSKIVEAVRSRVFFVIFTKKKQDSKQTSSLGSFLRDHRFVMLLGRIRRVAVRSTLASSSRVLDSMMAEVGRNVEITVLACSPRSSPRRVPIENEPVRDGFFGLMMPNLVCRLSKRLAFSVEFMPYREEITK